MPEATWHPSDEPGRCSRQTSQVTRDLEEDDALDAREAPVAREA
jgi:hypothetical protein